MYREDTDRSNLRPSDWERVVIIHSRDDNNMWAPSRALLSAHSGYSNLAWGDIQNTLTTDEVNAGKAKDPNGVRNNDHPKVYVSWSKHANFDTRNTGWNDPASQSLENAFRSQDWWHFVAPQNYVGFGRDGVWAVLTRVRSELMRALMLERPLDLPIGEMQAATPLLCILAFATLPSQLCWNFCRAHTARIGRSMQHRGPRR